VSRRSGTDGYDPIWWWRDGELPINSFSLINEETALLNHMEFVIDQVAAVNPGPYVQQFVYVRTKPSAPTGLYDSSTLEKDVAENGYAYEEFAIFDGRFVKRTHYDDGATLIDGKPTEMNDMAELRVRYLSTYNFIIAAHNSPISNHAFDRRREDILTGMLKGDCNIEDLVAEVCQLERNRLMDYEF
jgi:hypothetical protein